MQKLTTILISILIISSNAYGQHGFTIEYIGGGTLYTIDLLTATKTPVGPTMNNFGAGDFGPNETLYAINSGTDELYQIDTTNGATTLIGSIVPPVDHIWTGMAYDESSGIMYGYSSYGIATGECSLHIIDLNNATYSLVGTQSVATAIGCIAIDGTGQMYGMQMGASAKIYMINKTDGSVTLIGNTGQGAAGMGHGMDWSNSDQTMYLTTYNSSTFENTLRIVNLTNGSTTQVGGLLGMWTGVIAIPGSTALSADFSSDVTDVCAGGVVNFTDQSSGATSWDWTFEGGTPASSTSQNPVVTYNTIGEYDVTLEISDGSSTSTLLIPDMITVNDIPGQPDTPTGPVDICGNEEHTYTTNAVAMAESYIWEVLPSDAGVLSGTGTSAVFLSAGDWSGSYVVKVKATNSCGTSSWSSELSCNLNFTPETFFIVGGGAYCEGDQGMELTLDGSEVDVNYELFLDGVSTGILVSGTGSTISFGYQTDEGIYTAYGASVSCTTLMFGEAYVTIEVLPDAATQPSGPSEVCSGTTSDYQTSSIPNATTLIWTLTPTEAGTIVGGGENISIGWSVTYLGMAYLSVYGSNDCGDGDPSDDLDINVNEIPTPEIMGETMVCKDEEYIYSTVDNTGSTYAWEIQGGNIVSGSGTNEIIVLWTTIGSGNVLVTETSAVSCEGSSETLNVVIDECTIISESTIGELKIYPNPAKDIITINFNSGKITTYEINIYNQFGQQVYTAQANSNNSHESHQINIKSFPTGQYFVKIINSSNQLYQSRFEVVK